jgi:transcription antitermination factor NusG
MRLRNLFEKPRDFSEIEPGAREEIPNLTKLKDLEDLNRKINEYESSLSNYNYHKVPKSARETLVKLKSEVQSTIDHLHNKRMELESENLVGDIPKGLFNLFQTIGKECSTICDQYSSLDTYLYRGTKSSSDAFKGKPFDERRAKDSNPILSNALNQAFADAGIEARRDNSIFTSSSISQAGIYGSTYVIFPVNGFSFSYSKSIKDFVFDFFKFSEYFMAEHKDLKNKLHNELSTKESSVLFQYFKDNDYYARYKEKEALLSKPTDFAAIKEMINDGIIENEFEIFSDVRNIMTPEKVIEKLQINHTDLSSAIKSGHEVVIRGNYYAVSTKHKHLVRNYLQNHYEQSDDFKKIKEKEIEAGQGIEVVDGDQAGIQGVVKEFSGGDDNTVSFFDTKEAKTYTVDKSIIKKIKVDTAQNKKLKAGDSVLVIKPDSSMFGQIGKIDYVWSTGTYDVITAASRNEFSGRSLVLIDSTEDNKSGDGLDKSSDTTVFDEGDIVKVIDGAHKGKTGKVTYFSSNFGLDLDVGGETISLPASSVEKVTNTTSFDFLDQIKVIKGLYKGDIGHISYLYNNGSVELKLNSGGYEVFKPHEVEKIGGPLFIEGDEVSVVAGDYKGKTGKVENADVNGTVDLNLDGTYVTDIPFKHIKKIKDTTPAKDSAQRPKFKEGDFVLGPYNKKYEVIEIYKSFENKTLARISSVDGTKNFRISLSKLKKWEEPKDDIDSDFELIDIEDALTIPEAGDSVIVNKPVGTYSKYKNLKGVVVKTSQGLTSDILTIKFDNGTTADIPEPYVEKTKSDSSQAAKQSPEKNQDKKWQPMNPKIKAAIADAKQKGYITYITMHNLFPVGTDSEQIEDFIELMSELGINVVESD